MTPPEETAGKPAGREQRIDPPHTVRPTSASALKPAPVLSGQAAEVEPLSLYEAEPIAGQAQQLAEWLKQQEASLSARVEAITSQEAEVAAKLNSARQWLAEQQADLERREAAIEQREASAPAFDGSQALQQIAERHKSLDARQATLDQEAERIATERATLGERVAQLDARQTALNQRDEAEQKQRETAAEQVREIKRLRTEQDLRHAELVQLEERRKNQEATLHDREQRLAVRAREIATALERFERLGVTESRLNELEQRTAAVADRQRRLAESERVLLEQRNELARRRTELEARQHEAQAALEADRKAFETERTGWQADARTINETAERRDAELDRREEALRQMQTEMQQTQRDVLEMRLATEETWAQLTGLLAPAALTRSIAKVRGELADHYGRTLDEISQSRGDLRDAADKLASEFAELDRRRISLEEWANRRYEELGGVAQRLQDREQELDRQQRQFERSELHWAAERDDYRDQIRCLLGELSDQQEAAAPPLPRLRAAA
ncbi:hypothetical protein [Botrimarina hoheduenensis]|uniref:Uncharacterized protein n=1 Tax=Botrimarina hoheduenensis TaxID=2528000 RepID=A0A5C5WC32_9BACT|nr:hypothetical protein [Botrimarina hoheduenensis]TWT48466.1 hypothetical protein Pla111_02340 [Botrimarina hoheduenensis]